MMVRTTGAELHCITLGRGFPILIPSGVGTELYRRQLPPQLAECFQLVVVDLRGGGESTGQASDLTFDLIAEDLDAVRRYLGAAQVAILGHSLLGMVALEVARRSPRSVSHAITVGSPPHGNMARLTEQARLFFAQDASEERKRIWRENRAALPADASPVAGLAAQGPLRCHDPHFDARRLFDGAVHRPELLGHLIGTMGASWDVSQDPASLDFPVLLTHGRSDYVVPYTLWDGHAEQMPKAVRHLFQRSGHQPFFEEPEEFSAVVARWLA